MNGNWTLRQWCLREEGPLRFFSFSLFRLDEGGLGISGQIRFLQLRPAVETDRVEYILAHHAPVDGVRYWAGEVTRHGQITDPKFLRSRVVTREPL